MSKPLVDAAARRIAWIDIARGIGIILVVYGHVLRGLIGAHLISAANPICASDYTIYTFHMPLFFLLAGLQVERSLSKGRAPFLKSKLMTIVYPYLLWSWFQLAVQMLAPKGSLNTVHPPITFVTILWRPVEQFWFLYVLLICHFVAFATKARRVWLMPFAAIGILVAVLIAIGKLASTQWVGSVAPWLVFYIAGIFLSRPILLWKPRKGIAILSALISAICFAFLSILCSMLSHSDANSIFSWPATAAGLLMTISFSQVLASAEFGLTDWMGILGRASMTIYIFHVLAAAGTRAALEKAHIGSWELQLLLGTCAGVCLPLLLHIVLDSLNFLPIFGLGGRRSNARPQPNLTPLVKA
ncbi:acyltransferase family protein [Silvibacterium sp.]|uniref:acyltransferase family protein n=1 Tax=Silvibacterium sp. TaxID=1964179 RepID=UPI0039E3252F